MPKLESSPKPRQQASESEAEANPPVSRQAPPPAGMGKFVDKTA
jgi:hypothetical protein